MTTTPQDSNSGSTSSIDDRQQHSLAYRATLRTIIPLQSGYRRDRPAAVAAVARLRREAGREVYATATGWGLDDLETLTALREEASNNSGRSPSRGGRADKEDSEDRAVHLAVTLWALHQQSVRDEPMHAAHWSLGRAVRQLAQGKSDTPDTTPRNSARSTSSNTTDGSGAYTPVEEVSPTIRKRFVRIGTSADFDTLGRRLREMVLLLRNARIPLDYGLLADQLTRWQNDASQGDVRRAWGRGFHYTGPRSPTSIDEQDTPAPAQAPDTSAEDPAG
ncbi:type I-E CRISPR-associated protein Cse2/CasB [Streptomyces sp. NPDC058301]|uniref:type I-E CRISPR-associated protein Cse2/CasB n=1 Tax=Streptomyces sp. NPDC058301 TaxID=3346436 RepID=UPI0036ED78EF